MFLRKRSAGESAKQSLNDYGRFAGVGLQFGVTLVLFAAAGYWLDQKFGTRPWLLISGVLLGSGGAFYSMIRRIPPSSKKTWAEKKREREEAARNKKSTSEKSSNETSR